MIDKLARKVENIKTTLISMTSLFELTLENDDDQKTELKNCG